MYVTEPAVYFKEVVIGLHLDYTHNINTEHFMHVVSFEASH